MKFISKQKEVVARQITLQNIGETTEWLVDVLGCHVLAQCYGFGDWCITPIHIVEHHFEARIGDWVVAMGPNEVLSFTDAEFKKRFEINHSGDNEE